MKKAISLSCFLLLSSCAFRIEDEESIRKAATNEIIDTLVRGSSSQWVTDSELLIVSSESETFNKYRALVKWPSRVFKTELRVNDEPAIVLHQNFIELNALPSGEDTNLHFSFYNELGGSLGKLSTRTTFTKDLLVSSELSLKGLQLINRLLITTGGRIITNGNDLTIKAKKIIVEDTYNPGAAFRPEDAHILTVLPGTKSPTAEGKPPHAVIKVEAAEGIGDLRVALVGFDGNDGVTPIVEHPPGPAGNNGTPGESLDVGKYCIDDKGRPCRVEVACKVEPKAAEPGEPGVTGVDAANGQDGGDSGDLIVDVKEAGLFTVQVQAMPGLGGNPGLPGKGGPGGPPGKTPAAARGCIQPPTASQGPKGSDGKKGKAGSAGAIGFIEAKGTKLQILERAFTE